MFSHKHTIFYFYVHIKTHEVWWCARRLVSLRKTTTYIAALSLPLYFTSSHLFCTHTLASSLCMSSHTHRQMSSTLKLNGWPDGESLSFSNKDLSLLSLHPSLPSSAFFSFCVSFSLFLASMCV